MTTERQRQQAAERKRERAEIQCESAEEDCDTAEGQRMVSEETRHFIEGVEHLREGASQDTLQRMTELMDRLEQRMSRVEARMVQATKEIREAVQAFRATMVHAQHHTMIDACDYWRTCFVIMPYKVRKFRGQSIDFDRIYYTIFTPAIQNVEVYDTKLKPHRADEPAQSRLLIHKMIQDLACSRLALADLTTYNPNVHYEVGLRHALVPSGTVLVSQPGIPIPFDLGQVLVTKYNDGPPEEVEISVRKISKALCETLEHNEIDNPVYAAGREFARRMGTAEQPTSFGIAVVDAEEAVLHGELDRAGELYAKAVRLAPEIDFVQRRQGSLLVAAANVAEIKASVEEALNAMRETLKKGVDPGEVLRALDSLGAKLEGGQRIGVGIVKRALEDSLGNIASNAGAVGSIVVQRMPDLKTQEGFDASSDTYGDMLAKGVIDPAKVAWSALQNTGNIAGLLLAGALITELPEKKATPAMLGDGGVGGI